MSMYVDMRFYGVQCLACQATWFGASNMFLLVVPLQILAQLDMQSEMLEKQLSGVDIQTSLLMSPPPI